jgi:hypothetical protein
VYSNIILALVRKTLRHWKFEFYVLLKDGFSIWIQQWGSRGCARNPNYILRISFKILNFLIRLNWWCYAIKYRSSEFRGMPPMIYLLSTRPNLLMIHSTSSQKWHRLATKPIFTHESFREASDSHYSNRNILWCQT